MDRMSGIQQYGTAFGGARDYYAILGYLADPQPSDYRARYDRDPIASRIIEFPPEETWRDTPTIKDGKDKDAKDDTPFCDAWSAFAERLHVYSYCQRVDTLAGIGTFGLLHIGVAGEGDLQAPVMRVRDPNNIIYLQAYGEESVEVYEWQTDPSSPRYGLPHIYRIAVRHMDGKSKSNFSSKSVLIHWSRCIHVAEGLLENEVFGRPRLQRVVNLLDDLLKVVGGSAEATWLLMRKGFVLDIDPTMDDMDEAQTEALNAQFEEYEHGIRRFIKTRGLKVNDLGSETVDPAGLFDAILTLISVATHIPKRILQGSEAGELASSQDAANWAGYVAGRQLNFAEPVILRPLIDRLIQWKVIPAPSNKRYTAVWDALFEMSDEEKARIADLWATAIQKMSTALGHPVVTAEEFRGELTPFPAKLPTILKSARLLSMQPPAPPATVPGSGGSISKKPPAAVPGLEKPAKSPLLNHIAKLDTIATLMEQYGLTEDEASVTLMVAGQLVEGDL
jgi:hypothetical protein